MRPRGGGAAALQGNRIIEIIPTSVQPRQSYRTVVGIQEPMRIHTIHCSTPIYSEETGVPADVRRDDESTSGLIQSIRIIFETCLRTFALMVSYKTPKFNHFPSICLNCL